MSDEDGPKDIPLSGQNPPPVWGSAYPPPPGGQYRPMPGQYPPGFPMAPKHPQATTAMVLGILGLVLCGVIGPFAWVMGSKAVKEIDANPHTYSGRSEANAGKIMGIIGTALLIFGVVILGGLLAIGLAVGTSSNFDYSGMRAY